MMNRLSAKLRNDPKIIEYLDTDRIRQYLYLFVEKNPCSFYTRKIVKGYYNMLNLPSQYVHRQMLLRHLSRFISNECLHNPQFTIVEKGGQKNRYLYDGTIPRPIPIIKQLKDHTKRRDCAELLGISLMIPDTLLQVINAQIATNRSETMSHLLQTGLDKFPYTSSAKGKIASFNIPLDIAVTIEQMVINGIFACKSEAYRTLCYLAFQP